MSFLELHFVYFAMLSRKFVASRCVGLDFTILLLGKKMIMSLVQSEVGEVAIKRAWKHPKSVTLSHTHDHILLAQVNPSTSI
jgi:hypothetical protein